MHERSDALMHGRSTAAGSPGHVIPPVVPMRRMIHILELAPARAGFVVQGRRMTDPRWFAPDRRVQLTLRADLLDQGYTEGDIKRRLGRRELTAVRPGVYVPSEVLATLGERQRHVLQIEATLRQLGPGVLVSHHSAACLLGIALLKIPTAVQVTRPGGHAGHRRSTVHTHCAAVDPAEIVVVDGHLVTGAARTVVDLARQSSFEQAVVAADSALRRGLVTAGELGDAVRRAARRPGVTTAQRVVRFADAGAESAGESVSRVMLHDHAVPPPALQVAIPGPRGDAVARSDFGWDEYRTVGEFDGAQKYGRLLLPGAAPGDAIFQEKIREDRIRALGWHVVRWTWSDLDDRKALATRILRALDHGAAMADRRYG